MVEEGGEMMGEDFQKIGRVLKTFGENGQLRCQVADEFRDLLLKDRFVWILVDGISVPFQIEQIRAKNKPLLIFSDIDSEKKANILSNRSLFIRTSDFDDLQLDLTDDGLTAHYSDLIGFAVQIDGIEQVATIEDVQIYPGQEMAFLKFADKEEPILVPMVPDFIREIDKETKSVTFRLPEGMIEL